MDIINSRDAESSVCIMSIRWLTMRSYGRARSGFSAGCFLVFAVESIGMGFIVDILIDFREFSAISV